MVIVSEVEDIVERNRWFFSFVLFAACILSGQYLMDLKIFQVVKANPLVIGKYFLYYLACGFIYSSVRWVYFLWKFRFERNIKLEIFRTEYKNKNIKYGYSGYGIEKDDSQELAEYKFLSCTIYKHSYLKECPQFRNYKSRIVSWWIFWVPSFIGMIFSDFVRQLVDFTVESFSKTYQHISNMIVPEIKDPRNTNETKSV